MNLLLSFLELFWTFFKIGLFTFGGGYAMLPMIEDAVLGKGWIAPEEFVNFIAVSESTPGPFAINVSTYVGTTRGVALLSSPMGGVLGALCTTLGTVLPSFLVILLVAKAFEKFKESRIVKGAMTGLKPAVIGLIASAVLSVGKTVFFPDSLTMAVFQGASFYISLGLFAVMLVLAIRKISPILIIVLSAVVGIVFGYALQLPV